MKYCSHLHKFKQCSFGKMRKKFPGFFILGVLLDITWVVRIEIVIKAIAAVVRFL